MCVWLRVWLCVSHAKGELERRGSTQGQRSPLLFSLSSSPSLFPPSPHPSPLLPRRCSATHSKSMRRAVVTAARATTKSTAKATASLRQLPWTAASPASLPFSSPSSPSCRDRRSQQSAVSRHRGAGKQRRRRGVRRRPYERGHRCAEPLMDHGDQELRGGKCATETRKRVPRGREPRRSSTHLLWMAYAENHGCALRLLLLICIGPRPQLTDEVPADGQGLS